MKHAAWILLLALACCTRPVAVPPGVETASRVAACRVGPDGAPPLADRGIGGTGGPAVQVTERGIGGTGIIGVITGFASVCVAGEEVALPEAVPTQVDGRAANLDDLRAGQVAAIQAAGPPGSLQAQRIVVRHVVIGPVQAAGPGTLTVAGQVVMTSGAAGTATAAKPGQWVAVSGLREGHGNLITATRIDPAVPGRVLIRGELIRSFGAARVGSLTVQLPERFDLPAGWPVTLTGSLRNGVLIADTAERDLASESPSAYFGPAVANFIVEGFVAEVAGGYFVDRDFIAGRLQGRSGPDGRSIVRFERGPAGLVAQPGGEGRSGSPGSSGFVPAPTVPGGMNRSVNPSTGGFGGLGSAEPGLGGPGFGGLGLGGPGLGGLGLGGLGLGGLGLGGLGLGGPGPGNPGPGGLGASGPGFAPSLPGAGPASGGLPGRR